jgi:transposase, IS30 family
LRRRDAAKYHKCSAILKEVIRPLLVLGLSPEQIAGRMNIETVSNYLSCNAIYTLVKREQWQHLLARKGKAYKKRQGVEAGAKLIPGRVDIRERPSSVDDKIELGHWGGDTVYG